MVRHDRGYVIFICYVAVTWSWSPAFKLEIVNYNPSVRRKVVRFFCTMLTAAETIHFMKSLYRILGCANRAQHLVLTSHVSPLQKPSFQLWIMRSYHLGKALINSRSTAETVEILTKIYVFVTLCVIPTLICHRSPQLYGRQRPNTDATSLYHDSVFKQIGDARFISVRV